MQKLLPFEHFKHAIDLQPMEIENKNKNSLSARTPNEDITSAVNSAEPHAEYSTLPEKI